MNLLFHSTYGYYNNGNRKSVKYPDGTTETYTYDKVNRVTGLTNAKGNGTVISSYSYTYDAAGNQLTKKDSKGITTYTYDKDNRLSTVTEPEGKKTSYTYDAAGNRKSEDIIVSAATSSAIYVYDKCNRLVTKVASDGTDTRFLYDQNGNLISKSIGKVDTIDANELSQKMLSEFDLIINKGEISGTGTDLLAIYSYDNYNRLTKLKTANKTTTYKYNAQGYRVEKKTNSKTTKYLYEYDKVVLETDENNNQTAFQVYGTNLLYRSAKGDTGSTQSYYYLYNAHGDVTSLLDPSGNIVSYDYDAFGNIKGQTGTADNPIRYAGYQYDEESGLYYLNARYYDSLTARFITEDTYRGQANDPLSLNLYTYCLNNPNKYADPSGHAAGSIVDYLKSQGENSSFSARKEIAKDLGIKNYTGTAAQNTQLLKKLQNQEAEKAEVEKRDAAKKASEIKSPKTTPSVTPKSSDDIVVTRLKEEDFLPIKDDDGNTYFGGNQDWYPRYTQTFGGCGPVAAANLLAYLATTNSGLSGLYNYNLTKDDYEEYMDEIYQYVKPNEVPYFSSKSDKKNKQVGLPSYGTTSVYDFNEGVLNYAKDKGVQLNAEICLSNRSTFDTTSSFIKEGLENNSPVALLDVFDPVHMTYTDPVTSDVRNATLEKHWVVITGMIENKATGEVTLEISTWGSRGTISLNEIYDNQNWNEAFYPVQLIYYTTK